MTSHFETEDHHAERGSPAGLPLPIAAAAGRGYLPSTSSSSTSKISVELGGMAAPAPRAP